MHSKDFSLKLSPNLGCPQIISLEEIEKSSKSLQLIIAGQYGEFTTPTKEEFEGAFKLIPSYSGEGYDEEIDLVVDCIEEITNWNKLYNFAETKDTMTLISSKLNYKVFEEKAQYWKITVQFSGLKMEPFRQNQTCSSHWLDTKVWGRKML